jgi:hypothetical protein
MKKTSGKLVKLRRKHKKQSPSDQLERLSKRLASEKIPAESLGAIRGAASERLYRRIIE